MYESLLAYGVDEPAADVDVQYENLLADILLHGTDRGDRTGIGTRSVFGRQLRYDLSKGFPRITTRFLAMKPIKGELLWFIHGGDNTRELTDQNIHIWDEWAGPGGELGPVYGAQWRGWKGPNGRPIDQLAQLINDIRENPNSRRLIVSAWNVADLPHMALPPCHVLFQCYVADGRLSLHVYQRSADAVIGLPCDIASYALLTHLIAQQTGLEAGDLVWSGSDIHIYHNLMNAARTMVERASDAYPFPEAEIQPAESIFDYTMDDIFVQKNYQSHPKINLQIAV